MKITLPVAALTALERFVSREETRYYLNGVCIEKHPKEGILLIATDGARLGVWHEKNCAVEGEWTSESIIISLRKRHLQHINCGANSHNGITYATIDTDEKSVLISECGEYAAESKNMLPILKLHEILIDGTFPNWRKVIPKVEKLEPVSGDGKYGYNIKFLADFGYVDQSHGQALRLYGNGDEFSPVIVLLHNTPQFVGVLMPARIAPLEEMREGFDAVLSNAGAGVAASTP